MQAGLKVYQAKTGTIAANLASFASHELSELTMQQVCGGHGQGHGHGHGCPH
jgi:predicted Fe-Mo cluster-binding NifX family protein